MFIDSCLCALTEVVCDIFVLRRGISMITHPFWVSCKIYIGLLLIYTDDLESKNQNTMAVW